MALTQKDRDDFLKRFGAVGLVTAMEREFR